jgi:hypothetical protein
VGGGASIVRPLLWLKKTSAHEASDEADVFLESRNDGERELQRNAMVSGKPLPTKFATVLTAASVLLRVLEYYDGILILTTNRMRSFDIAVQSRIRMCSSPSVSSKHLDVLTATSQISQLDMEISLQSSRGISTNRSSISFATKIPSRMSRM